ncbi:hypothetical protein PYW08_007768 [Mythimna loreyi]|uniref:Uncharacterized protein n=1 Tax=Mythimna loreyi TaxID=667449 RepID=A0ACC2QEK9_9NEOP|nr:hypothetical protein PYW08_007768 [Mythimna loreyi]
MSQRLNMWSMMLLISVCGVCYTKGEYTPFVNIQRRQIKGMNVDGFAQFLGVPYADIDKNNPFGPAKPHPGLDDLDATESKKCPQIENKKVVGTLDCLTLNIYVPIIANKNSFPVMVFIRGDYKPVRTGPDDGSFSNLLHRDVMVVEIIYRVDLYGFICLDIPAAPGNQGLKDQVLALRWIKTHIKAFQGNPDEITIFGAGLGGDFVSLHLLSLSEKLFHRAIIQSGSALSPLWAKKPLRNNSLLKLANELGSKTSDIREALKYLSSISPDKILTKETYINDIGTNPCIEKKFKGVENFITQHPRNITTSKAGTIPVIIGYNDDEAAVFVNMIKDENIPLYKFADILMFENLEKNVAAEEDIRHFYIGDEEITKNVKQQLTNFVSDFFYGVPSQRMVDLLLKNRAKTVYRYIFSYMGERNLIKKNHNLNCNGATHGDELGYILNYKMFSKPTPQDQLMIYRMTNMWANFAKFGNPIPKATNLLPIVWNVTTKDNLYLDINSNLSMKVLPTHKRMAFWVMFDKFYGEKK